MTTWFDLQSPSDWAMAFFSIWAALNIKAGVVLTVAFSLHSILRRRASAATVHLHFAAAFVGLIVLTVAVAVAPSCGVPILPGVKGELTFANTPPQANVLLSEDDLPPRESGNEFGLGNHHTDDRDSSFPPDAAQRFRRSSAAREIGIATGNVLPAPASSVRLTPPATLALVVTAAWLAGALLLGSRLIVAFWRLGGLRRQSQAIDGGPVWRILMQTASELQIRRAVTLLMSRDHPVPMTWGIFRPVILLPEQALGWPAERLRLVLAHELAHVRRGDTLFDLVAQVACVVYWINPLAWRALSHLRLAREHACDDFVLGISPRATSYAEALLSVARHSTKRRFVGDAALAMARPSQIEARLRALLDESRNRRGVTASRLISGLTAATLLAIPLGLVRPVARAEPAAPPGKKPAADSASPKPIATQLTGMPWQRLGTRVSAFGTVVDDAGKPLAGATVFLREPARQRVQEEPWEPDPQDILAKAHIDGDGRFQFREIPTRPFRWDQTWTNRPTPWDIVAQAPGMGMAWKFLPAVDNDRSLDFQLVPEASLRGKAIDDRGKPISDVLVKVALLGDTTADSAGFTNPLLSLVRSRLILSTKTRADGRFTLAGLPRERVASLVFEHPDYALECLHAATSDLPQPDSMSRWGDDRVSASSTTVHTGELDVKLRRGPILAGKVILGRSGRVGKGLRILLGEYGYGFRTITDGSGNFKFRSMPDAAYSLTVLPPEGANYLGWRKTVRFAPDQMTVSQEPRLQEGQFVSGRILDHESGRGIAGVHAAFDTGKPTDADDPAVPTEGVSDEQGRFQLVAPSGKGTVHIFGEVRHYDLPPHYAYSVNKSLPKFASFRQTVEVPDGGPLTGVEFKVGHGLVLRGLVVDEAGKPGANVEVVRLRGGEGRIRPVVTRTDHEGRFLFDGFPANSGQNLLATDDNRKLRGWVNVPAEQTSGLQQVVETEISLLPMATATGLVMLSDKPAAGISVSLSFGDDGVRDPVYNQGFFIEFGHSRTNAEGRFQFPDLPTQTPFRLSIHAKDATEVNDFKFKIEEPATADLGEFDLYLLDQTFSGIVIEADGSPAESALVEATQRRNGQRLSPRKPCITDKQGRFTYQGAPDLGLNVTARAKPVIGAPVRSSRPIYVDPADKEQEVRIVLPRK